MIVMSVDLFNIYENNPFVYKFKMQKKTQQEHSETSNLCQGCWSHI